MNLVFKEYINFLKDNGLTYPLKEGYYWQDNSIIKAFDTEGNIHKIVRINVDDELNITFKLFPHKDFEIISWMQLLEKHKTSLECLEQSSLNFLNSIIKKNNDKKKLILTSGGKDSAVTSYLVKKILPDVNSLFNNSTLDCADTYRYIKNQKNIKILTHNEGFYIYRKRLNFIPTRFTRVCCKIYKEQEMIKVLNPKDKYLFFMGMRNDESSSRKDYQDIWKNDKWGNRDWIAALPIRKWSEFDVWLYILFRNIPINEKYKKGYRRVGCAIACPYYSKTTWVLDKYWYPFLYNRWHDILKNDFIENKKASVLNCTLEEYHYCWSGGIYRKKPTEEVIKEFADMYDLPRDIAEKYFNKTCIICNKKLKKDDIALCLKFNGRITDKFKCIKCLANDLNTTEKELKLRAATFKKDGCELF